MDQLDQQRQRIQADLRGLVDGDVRCDDVFLQLYASDGSIYEIQPLGVVRPRSIADVTATLQYATEKQISVHARGAGTGVAGESLGSGLVMDFSRHLRRVLRIDAETVRVQPGVVHERLNAQLHSRGRVFGPDPTSSNVTTIGSMIAVDAVGSRWLKYGSVRRHVRGLQIVLADGHVMHVGREPLVREGGDPRKRELVRQVARLLSDHAELIRRQRPESPRSRCGYDLSGVLTDEHLDLAQLLVGSEGTLALITEATLATQPLPRHRGVALLLFESLDKASRAALDILAHEPSACDLLDRRHVSLAREIEVRFDLLIPAETEAVVLVEQDGDDPVDVMNRLQRVVDEVWHRRHLAFGARHAFDAAEAELFWTLANEIQPALCRMKGPSRPVPMVEGMAVPPQTLPDFLVRVQNVLKRHHATASLFCHVGQGQLHVQPFIDLAEPKEVRRMQHLAEGLYEEVFKVGGTISGEHACGLSRSGFIRRQVGPLYDVFCRLKSIFDPNYTLNPGKIVGVAGETIGPELLTRNLSPPMSATPSSPDPSPETPPPETPSPEVESPEVESTGLRDLVELQLNWDPARVVDTVADCGRCGDCRAQAPGTRMCPVFRSFPMEESSPRAKANLIRSVLTGRVDLNSVTSEEFKEVVDLCIHCQMCRLECPTNVDVSRLAREGKGAYVAANGLPVADWIMTRLDLFGKLACTMRPVVNWAVGNRQMRWLLEKTLGIAHGRKLPRVASQTFLHRAARRRLTRPVSEDGRKVVYLVDVYANYFDPQLAEAMVAVFQHNGVSVYVPPQQRQAGMTSVAYGDLDYARYLATHNVTILAEAVRRGYQIVATEPSAVLCLVHEYPELIDDDDARLVARHST
ncbi:MAG: FAD-binding protein, partial [Candidatus Nealsonbacteria bacterium]|nr:FAD-binding protein [Candidatus Nealsonbacteria bacterium]